MKGHPQAAKEAAFSRDRIAILIEAATTHAPEAGGKIDKGRPAAFECAMAQPWYRRDPGLLPKSLKPVFANAPGVAAPGMLAAEGMTKPIRALAFHGFYKCIGFIDSRFHFFN